MANEYTKNYNLDLYTVDDRPNLLKQYNSAMNKIDEQLEAEKTRAENEEQTLQNGINTNTDNIAENTSIIWQNVFNGQFVAHQGAISSAPGNSEPAYNIAGQTGYKIIECDVRKTSDGILITSHDDDISLWTDGVGHISSMTYAELMNYNITKGAHASRYPNTKYCMFTKYLQICKSFGILPLIEDKIADPITIADTAFSIIGERFAYMGTLPDCIKVRNKYPNCATIFLAYEFSDSVLNQCVAANITGLHVSNESITDTLVKRVHEKGMIIGCCNTNDKDVIKNMRQTNVDFINVDGALRAQYATLKTSDIYTTNAFCNAFNVPVYSPLIARLANEHKAMGCMCNITHDEVKPSTLQFNIPTNDIHTCICDMFLTDNPSYFEIADNDYYRYIIRCITDTTEYMSPYLTKGRYLVPARLQGRNLVLYGYAAKDGSILGDIDLINAPNFIHHEEPIYSPWKFIAFNGTEFVQSETDITSKPMKCAIGDKFKFLVSADTNNEYKYALHGFTADMTKKTFDSGWITEDKEVEIQATGGPSSTENVVYMVRFKSNHFYNLDIIENVCATHTYLML